MNNDAMVEARERPKYAGADWVRASLKVEPSEVGALAADILGEVFRGIYHVPDVEDVDWKNDPFIVVKLGRLSLSTFDSDLLTRLVVLAHDRCVRIQVSVETETREAPEEYGGGEYEQVDLVLMFHKRKGRKGRMMERHPTLEQAIAAIRGT